MERRHDPVLERRGPHGDRRAALDLAPVADDAARAAADQHVGLQRVVDALERRLGRGEMRAAGEHDREVDARCRQARAATLAAASTAPARGSDAVDSPHAMRTLIAFGRYSPAARRPYCLSWRTARARAVRPDRRRQDRRRDRARRADPRARRPAGRRLGRRAAGLPAAWRSSPASPTRAQLARLEHRLIAFLPIDARFSVAEYARLAHAEIDGLLADGATPDRRRRHRPVPARRARRARAAPAAAGRPCASTGRPSCSRAARRRCTPSSRARRRGRRRRSTARDRHRIIRALELHDQGALHPPAPRSQLWTRETRHPTRLVGLVRDRDELYARIEGARRRDGRRRGVDEVRRAHAAGASPTARVALGFEQLLAGDVDAMKRRTRNYARRQLDVDAQAARRRDRRDDGAGPGARRGPHRLPARMTTISFEKWQALGNDYLIFESAALPSS